MNYWSIWHYSFICSSGSTRWFCSRRPPALLSAFSPNCAAHALVCIWIFKFSLSLSFCALPFEKCFWHKILFLMNILKTKNAKFSAPYIIWNRSDGRYTATRVQAPRILLTANIIFRQMQLLLLLLLLHYIMYLWILNTIFAFLLCSYEVKLTFFI